MSFLSPKAGYWFKTLSKFVSVQLVVQSLGFASGILLIRTLDKQEYAYFTLANSMQGTMNVLASTGISSALSSIGGKIWQDPYRFGQLINTAMLLRRYLAVGAVTIVTPISIWMLLKNGASFTYAILLTIGILIELYFYSISEVLITIPRLHSQISRIQNLDLSFAFSRLILLLGAYLTFFNALAGVFASTIASGFKNVFLWNWIKDTIDIKAHVNKNYQKETIKLIKEQAPNNIFYCIQGQLTIFLIAFLGKTENIAEVGALTRLSLIFVLITTITTNIFLPALARCQPYNILRKRYLFILIFYLSISGSLIFCGAVYPKEFLWILGSQYNDLHGEIFVLLINASMNFIYFFIWRFNLIRGWVKESFLFIPTTIIVQVITLFFLDISTVKGILLFNTFPLVPMSMINLYVTFKGFKQLK